MIFIIAIGILILIIIKFPLEKNIKGDHAMLPHYKSLLMLLLFLIQSYIIKTIDTRKILQNKKKNVEIDGDVRTVDTRWSIKDTNPLQEIRRFPKD